MTDLRQRLSELDQLDAPDMRASIDQRAAELDRAAPQSLVRTPASGWRGPLIAVGTALVILIVAAGSLLLIGRDDSSVVEEPTPTTLLTPVTTTTTTEPTTTTTLATSLKPPFTLPSEILPASEDPFEWRWEGWRSFGSETSDVTGLHELVWAEDCFGGDQPLSAVVAFNGGSIDFSLGYRSTPDIVVTDADGGVTQVGNPFGELAWLCSVAATDTHILAVGSGVSWSEDGIAWHGIEAFEHIEGSDSDGSYLLWAAAGEGGYMVLGEEGVVWFSEDLETWHEIHLKNDDGSSVWGWGGPTSVSVEEEIVITRGVGDEGWIGTRP